MFTRLLHPLSIGLTLIVQTCLVCVTTGINSQSNWFSYILFLIFLGGLLVLFIYVASLASNELFSFSIRIRRLVWFVSFFVRSLIFIDIIILSYKISFIHSSVVIDTLNYLKLTGAIYRLPTITLTLYLVRYLLLTLFAVVKITGTYFGPLRLSTYDNSSTKISTFIQNCK